VRALGELPPCGSGGCASENDFERSSFRQFPNVETDSGQIVESFGSQDDGIRIGDFGIFESAEARERARKVLERESGVSRL